MRVTLVVISSTTVLSDTAKYSGLERTLYSFGCALSFTTLCCPSEEEVFLQLQNLSAGSDAVILLGYASALTEVQSALSRYLGEELVYSEEYESFLKIFLDKTETKLLKDYKRLCLLPCPCKVVSCEDNFPAALSESKEGKILLVSDLTQAEELLNSCFPEELDGANRRIFKLFGLSRTEVLELLQEILREYRRIAEFYVFGKGLDITLSVLCKNKDKFKSLYDVLYEKLLFELHDLFKKNLYAEEDVLLENRLYELLILRGKVLSVAESLTGGQISSRLVAIPNTSQVFFEDAVTYSNEAKVNRLSVTQNTLKKYGAVSSECAYEMAAGLLNTKNCDIAIATTGLAGPGGASDKKPLGLTYIAVGSEEGIHVFEHHFEGNREQITESAANAAFFYGIQKLQSGNTRFAELKIKE